MSFVGEVQLNLDFNSFTGAHVKRSQWLVAKAESLRLSHFTVLDGMLQFVIFLLTFIRDALSAPCECRQIDCLIYISLKAQLVTSASGPADALPLTWILCLALIILFHELCRCPARLVEADRGLRESILVSGDINEEDAIFTVLVASLLLRCLIPFIGVPGAMEAWLSPWVTNFNQFLTSFL